MQVITSQTLSVTKTAVHRAGERNDMANVVMYERAALPFAATLARRGHHIVYRANASNHCPGCGRSHWYVGRVSAECGFCGTAVPLAEVRHDDAGAVPSTKTPQSTKATGKRDQRRHERIAAQGRKLQLLIDGSPTSFALQNISEGGAMGEGVSNLTPGADVCVRLRGASSYRLLSNGPTTVSWV